VRARLGAMCACAVWTSASFHQAASQRVEPQVLTSAIDTVRQQHMTAPLSIFEHTHWLVGWHMWRRLLESEDSTSSVMGEWGVDTVLVQAWPLVLIGHQSLIAVCQRLQCQSSTPVRSSRVTRLAPHKLSALTHASNPGAVRVSVGRAGSQAGACVKLVGGS
jgi:hypothetical protein